MAKELLMQRLLDKDQLNFDIKVYIKDDGIPAYDSTNTRDPEWVDFTDHIGVKGENRLKSIGSISSKTEGREGIGSFITTIRQIDCDNSDNFWTKPIPRISGVTYGRSYPTTLITEFNHTAYFSYSKNYTANTWFGRLVRVDLRFLLNETGAELGTMSTHTIGVFEVDGLQIDKDSMQATLTLSAIGRKLRESPADTVRDGLQWYEYRSVPFLVKKIIDSAYRDSSGKLKIKTNIDTVSQVLTPEAERNQAGVDNRWIGTYGATPDYLKESDSWVHDPGVCRSLCVWHLSEAELGTLSVASDGSEVATLGSWSYTSGEIILKKHDVVVIEESTYGNNGYYEIKDVNYTTGALTFYQTFPKAESGMNFTITRVYMGVDNKIYEFNPEKEFYVLAYTLSAAVTGDSSLIYHIKRLWHNTNDNKLYFAAWIERPYNENKAGVNTDFTYNTLANTLKIGKLESVSTLSTNKYWDSNYYTGSILTTKTNFWSGEGCYRGGQHYINNAAYNNAGRNFNFGNNGVTTDTMYGENMLVPFEQYLLTCKADISGGNAAFSSVITEDDDDTKVRDVGEIRGTISGVASFGAGKEVHAYKTLYATGDAFAAGVVFGGSIPSTSFPCHVRFSLGQEGFVVFNQSARSNNGAFIFTTIDYSSFSNNQSLSLDILAYNLGTASYETVTEDLKETITIAKVDSGGGTSSMIFPHQPISGTAVVGTGTAYDGHSYFSTMVWQDGDASSAAIDTPVYRSKSYIWEIDTSLNLNATPIYKEDDVQNTSNMKSFIELDNRIVSTLTTHLTYIAINRAEAKEQDFYEFGHILIGGALSVKYNTRNQLCGLVSDPSDADVYFFECNIGLLRMYNYTKNKLLTVSPFTPVRTSQYINTKLALDFWTRKKIDDDDPRTIVYGISAPANPYAYYGGVIKSGKYYLWKADIRIPIRIELAQFDSGTKWDKLEQLGEVTNALVGFDADEFFFTNKILSESISYTVNTSALDKNAADLTVDDGVREVYNKVSIIPTYSKLADAEVTVRLASRDDDEKDNSPSIEVAVEQDHTRPMSMQLTAQTYGSVEDSILVFSYKVSEGIINTTLKTTISNLTDTALFIEDGINSINYGDRLELSTSQYSIDYLAYGVVAKDPSSSDKASSKITLIEPLLIYDKSDLSSTTTPVSNMIVSGADIIIRKHGEGGWSGEEVNLIGNGDFENDSLTYGWTIGGTTIVSADTGYFKTGDNSIRLTNSNDSGDYLRKSFNVVGGSYYSVSAYVRSDGKIGTTALVKGSLTMAVTGAVVSGWTNVTTNKANWISKGGTFKATANGVASLSFYGNDVSNKFWIDQVVVVTADKYSGEALKIYHNDLFYEVGKTGVRIKLYDSNIADIRKMSIFKPGDIIDINLPGLKIEKEESSKQIALDTSSIEVFGPRDFPTPDNPFFNFNIARLIAGNIINKFAFPKYIYKITTSLMPILGFMSTSGMLKSFYLVDEEILSNKESNRSKGYLRSVTHNPSSGTSEFEIKDENPY